MAVYTGNLEPQMQDDSRVIKAKIAQMVSNAFPGSAVSPTVPSLDPLQQDDSHISLYKLARLIYLAYPS